MKSLDAAIEHALSVAKTCDSAECSDEHRQLAEWLSELRDHRKTYSIDTEDAHLNGAGMSEHPAKTNAMKWYCDVFLHEFTGWRDLRGEDAIEVFIRAYERYAPKVISVPCIDGELSASFFGDPGVFDGIMVDFSRERDGMETQCALVETDRDMEGELHTYCWDGEDEQYVHKQVVAKEGDFYGDWNA